MIAFNFHTYMLDCATRLKSIGHTSFSPRFFRANSVLAVEELLNNIGVANYPAIIILDSMRGRVGDEAHSGSFIDNPFYTFFVIGNPAQGDPDLASESKLQAKQIGFQILARMRRDRQQQREGLNFMKFASVPYQEIGPIGAGSYGVMFNFEVPNCNVLTYTAADWLPVEEGSGGLISV